MIPSRVRAILVKEWQELRVNRGIWLSFVGMALILVVLCLGLCFALPEEARGEITAEFARGTDEQPALFGPESLSDEQRFQVFILLQFSPLFLILPIIGSMSIATYSIIGEKLSGSLEAILASPVTTRELIFAKSLAATVPSVVGTWVAFAILWLGVFALGGWPVARFGLGGSTLGAILLIAPLVSLLALGVGVIVSARSSDPRSAQQIGGFLVLPIVAWMTVQSAGLFILGPAFLLAAAAILLILDILVLWWGASRFQREEILVRWK